MGCDQKKLYRTRVAVTPAPVSFPIQRPLVPTFTLVRSETFQTTLISQVWLYFENLCRPLRYLDQDIHVSGRYALLTFYFVCFPKPFLMYIFVQKGSKTEFWYHDWQNTSGTGRFLLGNRRQIYSLICNVLHNEHMLKKFIWPHVTGMGMAQNKWCITHSISLNRLLVTRNCFWWFLYSKK